jgi:hypothetical protein
MSKSGNGVWCEALNMPPIVWDTLVELLANELRDKRDLRKAISIRKQ